VTHSLYVDAFTVLIIFGMSSGGRIVASMLFGCLAISWYVCVSANSCTNVARIRVVSPCVEVGRVSLSIVWVCSFCFVLFSSPCVITMASHVVAPSLHMIGTRVLVPCIEVVSCFRSVRIIW